MSGAAVFTAEDADGNEFMGLLIQEGYTEVKIYLGHSDTAPNNVRELTSMMQKAANNLKPRKIKTKLIEVNGALGDGHRTAQGRI